MNLRKTKKQVNHAYFWLIAFWILSTAIGSIEGNIDEGLLCIIPCVIGNLWLFAISRKKYPVRYFNKGENKVSEKKKMTVLKFLTFVCAINVFQLIFYFVSQLIDKTGATGTSIETTAYTIPMIIYITLAAPISEELSYRGFLRENLAPLGKIPTMVLSAVAFGLMHANLKQAIFAIPAGIIYCYAASEYSLIWAMALHIFNNILATVSDMAEIAGNTALDNFFMVYLVVSAIAGVVLIIMQREEILSFIKDENNGSTRIYKEIPADIGDENADKGAFSSGWKVNFTSSWFYLHTLFFIFLIVVMMILPEPTA